MKALIALTALLLISACGKSSGNRAGAPLEREEKSPLTHPEKWTILSERPLPERVKVLINDREFINECTGLGRATFERTYRNGTIHLVSQSEKRPENFDLDLYDCDDESEFFSQDYVDQSLIEHPRTGEISIILRLRN